ncbi:hypothetical protein [Amycolatopsis pigmentata]|uniref:Uncharacterized protein n=1 Tax=Amycolatopsis pigmentata TaxID=450801 RepID=A0ABW5FLF8_9PSEU
MAKKTRNTSGRAAKLRRRAARAGKQRARHHRGHEHHGLVHVGPVPDGLDLVGRHVVGPGDDFDEFDDAVFDGPDEALMDASGCPVADRCAGCGGTGGLHAVTSAFSKPGGFDVACATLCHTCDNGRSFLHRLGPPGSSARSSATPRTRHQLPSGGNIAAVPAVERGLLVRAR